MIIILWDPNSCLALVSLSNQGFVFLRVICTDGFALKSYSKSLQVSWILNIQTDLNCAVVWIVLILLLISSLFSGLLETIPKAPMTNGITSLSCSTAFQHESSIYLFTIWSAWMAKFTSWQVLVFFCGGVLKLGLVFWSEFGYLFVSQIPRDITIKHIHTLFFVFFMN